MYRRANAVGGQRALGRCALGRCAPGRCAPGPRFRRESAKPGQSAAKRGTNQLHRYGPTLLAAASLSLVEPDRFASLERRGGHRGQVIDDHLDAALVDVDRFARRFLDLH